MFYEVRFGEIEEAELTVSHVTTGQLVLFQLSDGLLFLAVLAAMCATQAAMFCCVSSRDVLLAGWAFIVWSIILIIRLLRRTVYGWFMDFRSWILIRHNNIDINELGLIIQLVWDRPEFLYSWRVWIDKLAVRHAARWLRFVRLESRRHLFWDNVR